MNYGLSFVGVGEMELSDEMYYLLLIIVGVGIGKINIFVYKMV